MTQHKEYRTLTREELDSLAGEPLPERAAMSLVNANLAVPVNLAVSRQSRSTRASNRPPIQQPATERSRKCPSMSSTSG